MAMRDALRRAGFDVPPEEPERMDDMARRPNRGGSGGGQRGGGNRRQDRRTGGGGNRRNMPKLPDAYFAPDSDGKPCLRTEFVSKENMDALAEALAYARPNLTTGQARRFFNHCREIERRLQVEGESWQEVAASFESLAYHARYAQGPDDARRPGKIPAEFRKFIDDNVRRVKSSDDPGDAFLRGFLPHFEALIGFGAAHMRDRG